MSQNLPHEQGSGEGRSSQCNESTLQMIMMFEPGVHKIASVPQGRQPETFFLCGRNRQVKPHCSLVPIRTPCGSTCSKPKSFVAIFMTRNCSEPRSLKAGSLFWAIDSWSKTVPIFGPDLRPPALRSGRRRDAQNDLAIVHEVLRAQGKCLERLTIVSFQKTDQRLVQTGYLQTPPWKYRP